MASTGERGQRSCMRNLTNDYKDCRLIKLDPRERGLVSSWFATVPRRSEGDYESDDASPLMPHA